MRSNPFCLARYGVTAILFSAIWLGWPIWALAADGDNSWQPAPYSLGQGLYFPGQGLRIDAFGSVIDDVIELEWSSLWRCAWTPLMEGG